MDHVRRGFDRAWQERVGHTWPGQSGGRRRWFSGANAEGLSGLRRNVCEALRVVREFLDDVPNLQFVGRNGMHKYNNQDHSMLTAMLAVKNILGANYDLWQVNAEQEYHEEVTDRDKTNEDEFAMLAATQPRVPRRRDIASAVHAKDGMTLQDRSAAFGGFV